MKPAGCGLKRTGICDGDKIFQLSEIHACVLSETTACDITASIYQNRMGEIFYL